MATLSYASTDGFSCSVAINYSVSYDPATNRSTVHFAESAHTNYGLSGWSTEALTSISVAASDNPGSVASASFSTSGITNGGSKSFTGQPVPDIVVQHSDGPGVKGILISASSHFIFYYGSGQRGDSYPAGSGSTAMTTRYTLSISEGAGSVATVMRTASPVGAAIGRMANGAAIYAGDTLSVSYAASTGYDLSTCSPAAGALTVSGDVSVSSSATVKSYTLTLSPGTGAVITVNRTSSPLAGATTGPLSSGATIYHGDVLEIEAEAASGYIFGSATLNGQPLVSPHTVSGNVTVVATATQAGAWVKEAGGFASYQIMIFNGATWDTYIPYVYTGASWEVY